MEKKPMAVKASESKPVVKSTPSKVKPWAARHRAKIK
jgi:hypothetical protein